MPSCNSRCKFHEKVWLPKRDFRESWFVPVAKKDSEAPKQGVGVIGIGQQQRVRPTCAGNGLSELAGVSSLPQ